MSLNLLWVTDPWNTLAHSQDTTLRLHQEALNLGVPSYWSASDFILNPLNSSRFQAGIDSTKFVELEPSKIRQLHYRVDPPVNSNYLDLLEKIVQRIGDESRVLNPPAILRSQSEKLVPPPLSRLAPDTLVIRDEVSLNTALKQFADRESWVTKPLNQAQSKGVKLWHRTKCKSPEQDLRAETDGLNTPIVIQEYLPAIHQGELRMWFAAGHFIAALKKFPRDGDFRVLIDEGSKIEAYTLSAKELTVAEEVGATLRSQGVALAAVDFIGGKISDYNITSPGLLVQLEAAHGRNYAREILTHLLAHG